MSCKAKSSKTSFYLPKSYLPLSSLESVWNGSLPAIFYAFINTCIKPFIVICTHRLAFFFNINVITLYIFYNLLFY